MPKGCRGWSLEDRILDKINIDEVTDCWHFTGAKNNIGYGMIRKSKTEGMATAHKAMYELTNNMVVPTQFVVMHLCGNYDCVNPAHLDMATRKDVTNLLISKGYTNFFGGMTMKGFKHPKYKCEHCNKEYARNMLNKWHNDNCKNKPKHK